MDLVVTSLTSPFPYSVVRCIQFAIVVVFTVVAGFHIPTKTVGDIAAVSGSLPAFHIPRLPFTLDTLNIIFPYALIMAGVGLVESLLTLNVTDEITGTRGNSNRESVAQGAANILNSFFRGMGGCAMIA